METEAKFIVPDAAALARLREVTQFGPYSRGEVQIKQDHDRYVDTPDYRFYTQQRYVRLRERDGALLVTIKGLGAGVQGAVHAREEEQATMPGPDPATWPDGPVRRRVEQIADHQSLTDLVTLEQTRTVARLSIEGRDVAELSLDAVTIPTAHGPVQEYELEAELLLDGTAADLEALCHIFSDEYHLAAQPESKFERALRLAGGPPAGATTTRLPGITAVDDDPSQMREKKPAASVLSTDSLATAARKVARVQLERLLTHEAAAQAGGDIRAVHAMRVATRRLRLALRLATPFLPEKQARRLTRGARTLGRGLGEVRDLDVLLTQAQEFRATLPDAQQADLDDLLAAWTSQQQRAAGRLADLLDSHRYTQFKTRLQAFIDEEDAPPAFDDEIRPTQVRHNVGSNLWAHYEAVRAYETVMDAPELAQLHALRMAGKELRYSLEFFREVLPAETTTLIADVVALQDRLGALQDADVAVGLLRDYLAAGKSKRKPSTPPLGLTIYLASLQAALEHPQVTVAAPWTQISSPAWRNRLAAAIAAV